MGKDSAMHQRGNLLKGKGKVRPDDPRVNRASDSLNDRIETVNAPRHELAFKCAHMHDKQRFAALDWEDIRYFTVIARHGTLAGAARKLGATPQAVARRLENLERILGYQVFTREAGALVLNSAGAAVFGEAAQMEMAACSLLQKHRAAVPS